MHRSGLTENDGHENDGPSKLQDMKLRDKKYSHYSVNRDAITLHCSVQVFVVRIFLDTNTPMHCVQVNIYVEKT